MANQTIDTLSIKISATSSSAVKNLQNTAKAVKQVGNESAIATPKMKGLNGGILNLARAFGKFYASMFLVIRGIKALGRAIEKSMDYIETYNYFSVTLDKISKESASDFENWGYDSAEEYANSFSSRLNQLTEKMTGFTVGENGMLSQSSLYSGLGLDPNKVMNFQAQIMQITNSVGMLGEASYNTTEALSMLASDLSSFTNRDISEVMTNLQSGLIGQSRALYKYGIDITQASLEQEALNLGISKSVSEMSQSEKMYLRMIVILKNSRVAWGDQANTLSSVANQYRMLKEQVSNLGRIIGNVLMPIVQVVLPYVNALVLSLQKLFSFIGNALYGENWKNIMDGISSGVGDIDSGIEDVEDGLDGANDSAKKLKKTLLGFDELNVINSDTSSTGVGGLFDANSVSQALADAVNNYRQKWEEALAQSENKASEIADRIAQSFKNSFSNISNGFELTFNYENFENLKSNLESLAHSISNVFFSDEVTSSVSSFKKNTEETIGEIIGSVAELSTNFSVGITGGIADASKELEDFNKNKISSILDNAESLENTFKKIAESVSDFSELFKSDEFEEFVKNIAKIVDLLSVTFIEDVTGLLSDIINFFASSVIENLKTLKTTLEDTLELVNNLLSPLNDLIDEIIGKDGKYKDSFIHQFFEEIGNKNKFVGLYNVFDVLTLQIKAFNGVLKVLNDILEDLVYFWNNSGLKDLFSDIGGLISKLGVSISSNTLNGYERSNKKFQGFATGGFPEDGWFRASHGELIGQFDNGQSVVANNQQIIEGIKQGVYEAVSSAMGSGSTVVQIDGREVFRTTQSYASQYKRTTGKNAFAF